jgi:ABC-2 type transport system ATP-binding protein
MSKGLRKSFKVRKQVVQAVRGIDLQVRRGEIYGFLGPNGAGKTTTLRMLATLLPIDAGEALVAGFDVRRHSKEVRRHIGYVGQLGGADLPATGRENLILQGQIFGLTKSRATSRAEVLIEIFDLSSFVDRVARTYSGGQRRRLEVALGIVHKPDVLFLDEPTTGLDPQNRANLWDQLRSLRSDGVTIILTTHYLDEANVLADRLAIIDQGRIVAEGTPQELKRQMAGDSVVIKPKESTSTIQYLHHRLSREPFVREARVEGEAIRLYVVDGAQTLPLIFDRLRAEGVGVEFVHLSEPTLDDVFLQQTGRSLRDAGVISEGVVV